MSIGYLPMSADLLQIGHYIAINKASMLCDTLIIGLLTDKAIKKYKHHKPTFKYEERYFLLYPIASLLNILIVKQEDINPYKNLKEYDIDIMFSGDGWTKEETDAMSRADVAKCEFERENEFRSSSQIKKEIYVDHETTKKRIKKITTSGNRNKR